MTEPNDPLPTTARARRPANRQANSQVPPGIPPAVPAKNVTTAVSPERVGMGEIKKLLESKIPAIRRVIPRGVHITAESLVQNALLQIDTARDRKVKLCKPKSIYYAVLAAAAAGIDFIGDQGFLVAMSKKRQEQGEWVHDYYYASLICGYRAYSTIAARHGWFLDSQDVRANDQISIDLGANKIAHIIQMGDRGEVVGATCVIRRISDTKVFHIEAMDRTELEKVRQSTEPWKQWYGRMAMKSVARRAFNWVPKDNYDSRLLHEIDRRNDANEELEGLLTAGPGESAGKDTMYEDDAAV